MTDGLPTPSTAGGVAADASLAALLEGDPQLWRSALDRRYHVLDDVLTGHKQAVIYPAARMGRDAANRLKSIGVDVVAFGDRDPTLYGSHIDGLPVLSPAQVSAKHHADVILVSSTMYDSVICEDLEARGCGSVVPVGYLNLRLPEVFKAREYDGAWDAVADSSNRAAIEAAHALFADSESRRVFEGKLAYYLRLDKSRLDAIKSTATIYFDRGVFQFRIDEVVVDGGAYVGDTLATFLEQSSGMFSSYVAFEPDPVSFKTLETVAAFDRSRITAVQAGLASRTSTARFLSTHGADSHMLVGQGSAGESVPVVSLDEYFEGRPAPTMIKLDIEGAEADALYGARGLLGSATPLLAVSAYHYPADLWTLPLLMRQYMPASRLYLRHYTREVDDTVCYAIPDGRPTSGPRR